MPCIRAPSKSLGSDTAAGSPPAPLSLNSRVCVTLWGIATEQVAPGPAPRDIFHITTEADWAHAQVEGAYSLSTKGLTLAQVGFVHCAFEEQVSGVANSFFRGVANLVVLRIAIDRLNVEVRYEDLQGGHELFPHVYGPLNLDAVAATLPLAAGTDGTFSFSVPSAQTVTPPIRET